MKRRKRLLIGLGVIVALLAAILVFNALNVRSFQEPPRGKPAATDIDDAQRARHGCSRP